VRCRASACPDYVDRDLHRRRRSPVLKPVCGVRILGPAHSRPILRSHSISMVSDRPLQYVDHARPVHMVVNRAEDPSRFDRHHSHPKLPPCHTLDSGPRSSAASSSTVTPFVSGAACSFPIVVSFLYVQATSRMEIWVAPRPPPQAVRREPNGGAVRVSWIRLYLQPRKARWAGAS